MNRKTRASPSLVFIENSSILRDIVVHPAGAANRHEGRVEVDEDIKDAARKAFAPPEPETDEASGAPSLADRLFDFPRGTREKAVVSSWSATPSFRAGLAAVAEASGLSAAEVIRRGIFALALHPELLRDEGVDRLERRYEALLGAGGRRTHTKPTPS